MRINKNIIFKTVTVIMMVAVVVIAIDIMLNQKGLVEGYDFGVGAYYYVDVPDFEKIVDDKAYKTEVPVWMHAVLFVAWGWLMWRLWLFIDKK
ncbi:MAG: hypothetical protein PUC61_09865 [Bacteroidales bacterium]|nr:hypothetical protein [Bacteroidales bacterium]